MPFVAAGPFLTVCTAPGGTGMASPALKGRAGWPSTGSSPPPEMKTVDSMPGWVCRATTAPASISSSTAMVTYPGAGPSTCERTFHFTPAVAAGAGWADTLVAIKPGTAQSAQPTIRRRLRFILDDKRAKGADSNPPVAEATGIVDFRASAYDGEGIHWLPRVTLIFWLF